MVCSGKFWALEPESMSFLEVHLHGDHSAGACSHVSVTAWDYRQCKYGQQGTPSHACLKAGPMAAGELSSAGHSEVWPSDWLNILACSSASIQSCSINIRDHSMSQSRTRKFKAGELQKCVTCIQLLAGRARPAE